MSNPFCDLLQRLADLMDGSGITRETLDRLEAELREEWGGESYYFGRRGERDLQMNTRNRAIIRDWRNGERVELISRRYRITKRRVWQIVRG